MAVEEGVPPQSAQIADAFSKRLDVLVRQPDSALTTHMKLPRVCLNVLE